MSQETLYKDAIQEIASNLNYIIQRERYNFSEGDIWSFMRNIDDLKLKYPESKELQKMVEITFEMSIATSICNRFLYGTPNIILSNDFPYILEIFCHKHQGCCDGFSHKFTFEKDIISKMYDIKRSCSTKGCNEILKISFENDSDNYSRMYCSKCYKTDQVQNLLKNEQSNH